MVSLQPAIALSICLATHFSSYQHFSSLVYQPRDISSLAASLPLSRLMCAQEYKAILYLALWLRGAVSHVGIVLQVFSDCLPLSPPRRDFTL